MADSSKKLGEILLYPKCIEKNRGYVVLENGKESDWVCPRCRHEYWNVSLPLLHNIGQKERDEAGESR